MSNRRFEQAAELVGVLLFVAFVGFSFLVATLVGAVGEHGASTTDVGGASARAGIASQSPALSARTPSPPRVGQGGGEEGGGRLSAQASIPASTTISSPIVGSSGGSPTPATNTPTVTSEMSTETVAVPTVSASKAPQVSTPMSTVIVSSLPPPASSLEAAVRASVERWFSPDQWSKAMSVAACETHGTYNVLAVGAAGEIGVWQINPAVWGAVPGDIDGQTRLAASIVARYGWAPWSCQ